MGKVYLPGRTVTGIKAGQAVKIALNSRHPLSPSFQGTRRNQMLEIDLCNRQLTDDGLYIFITDLHSLLMFKDQNHPQGVAKLQGLHLQGNELTVGSLRWLGEVIQLSVQDLREVDLSNNNFRITSGSDVSLWERFLKCFSQCCVLKKIDFGNNPLGTRGVETFARVYIQSELYFLNTTTAPATAEEEKKPGTSHVSSSSVSSTSGTATASQSPGTRKKSSHSKGGKSAAKATTPADIEHYSSTRGLQSVPYIILSNVGMTNGNITHLSEVFKMRRSPEQLLAFLPKGRSCTLPDPENGLKGIYWLPNAGMVELSMRIMKIIAKITCESENELEEDFEKMTLYDDEDPDSHLESRQVRQKAEEELRHLESHHRIEVLGFENLHVSDLWTEALVMLSRARLFLLDDKDRPPSAEKGLKASRKTTAAQHLEDVEVPEPRYESRRVPPPPPPPHGVMISSLRFDPESSTFDFMFPAMHTPSPNPMQLTSRPAITAVLPTYPLHPVSKKSATKEHIPTHSQSGSGGRDVHPAIKALLDKPYRFEYRFGLPWHVWRKILCMTQHQNFDFFIPLGHQKKILEYSASWEGLAQEVSVNGATDAEQQWKVLDNMKCFTYAPLPVSDDGE